MIRAVFSKKIVDRASQDKRFVLLTGDHGYSLFDELRKSHSSQYINAGVAEQNMIGVAAGLAKTGFRPMAYGLSAFIPMRVLEQIKIDVCYENLPVIFIGDGAGVVYSHLGTSHQCTEDIAALGALPNLHILSPGDEFEMAAAMDYAFRTQGPVYIRVGKSDLGRIHEMSLSELKAFYFLKRQQAKAAIVATGPMARRALEVANEMALALDVISVPILKPFSGDSLVDALQSYQVCFSLEEHSVVGGLGSLLAQGLAQRASPTRLVSLGIQDRFSEKCGSYEYLLKEHCLDKDSIKRSIENGFKG